MEFNLSTAVSEDDVRRAIKIVPEVRGLTVTSVGYSTNQGYTNFKLTGDFKFKQPYELEVAGVSAEKFSGIFREAKIQFSGPGLEHNIAWRTDRSVVELRGRQLVPVTLSNITKTRCIIKRVPPYFVPEVAATVEKERAAEKAKSASGQSEGGIRSTPMPKLAPTFGGGGVRQESGAESQETASGEHQSETQNTLLKALADSGLVSKAFLVPFSDESEVFFAPEGADKIIAYSLPLSFRRNPDHGGAWLVHFEDADGSSSRSTQGFIQVTDLSVTYKRAEKSILFWVTSLNTGEPVPGVELMIDSSDGTKFLRRKDRRRWTAPCQERRGIPRDSKRR